MLDFKSEYLTGHLITYLGNKRRLLPFISETIEDIKKDLGLKKPSMFDGFSGSGCVSRLFKYYASVLYVNDLEGYTETINRCYLANKSEINENRIKELIDWLNSNKLSSQLAGFIENNYAPKNDNDIQPNERAFFTNKNARIIDTIRKLINRIDPNYVPFVLAPLLVEASIHNNTCGVFRGFYKNKDGIGHFGGSGENSMKRILAEIHLEYPTFSEVECLVYISRKDTNAAVLDIPEIDIAYYDPPYNQHPYGANYFMLNIINDYNDPEITDGVAGQMVGWNRTAYSTTSATVASNALDNLLRDTKAKYILVSYNNEGIIPLDKLRAIMQKYGDVSLKKQEYNAYKGSRNLKKRNKMVEEFLWVIRKF